MDKKYVTYEEFGAVGDGITEDFAAIYKAHEYANEHGLEVRAADGAHYYIHNTRVDGVAKTAIIRTNVNWGTAKFTIDDRELSTAADSDNKDMNINIFTIASDYPKERIDDREILDRIVREGLGENSTKVSLKFDYPVMIIPYNRRHNVYRRIFYGGFRGQFMREVIVLDKDGNIDESTPLMFNYNHIDYIDVIRLDVTPITVSGGEFTTRVSQVNCVFEKENGELDSNVGYLARGLRVERPFTKVKGVKHYVTDEFKLRDQVKDGRMVLSPNAYAGFYHAYSTHDVTFEDCILTARRCYLSPRRGTMGTYDLQGGEVNKLVFKNCVQSNFWIKIDEDGIIHNAKEGEEGAISSMAAYVLDGNRFQIHWGIGGSNFCKNMEYIGSTLSRFDAHCGLYNGKVINSTVNAMALIGKGKFIVENTKWFAQSEASCAILYLRSDYGHTWQGDITIKDVKAHIYPEAPTYVTGHGYYNWYFGYKCYFPNILIDNLTYYDANTFKPLPAGHEVLLATPSFTTEPAMHLSETIKSPPRYADVDEDGDGFVDGTDIPYDDVVERGGVMDMNSKKNLNQVTPPSIISIKGNDNATKPGKCRFSVYDSSKYGGVTDGGFFGKTEFVTDSNSYLGTDYKNQDTETFRFIDPVVLVKKQA